MHEYQVSSLDHILLEVAVQVMQISFGKGKESFWSNVFPSELVDHFSDDIKKVSWHLSPCASRPYSLSFDLSSVASSRQSSVSK